MICIVFGFYSLNLYDNKNIPAGHCLYEFGRAIVAERVLVQLGKHNLQLAGPNTQEFQVYISYNIF